LSAPNTPIIVMTSQSTNPKFLPDSGVHGLVGMGYKQLSSFQSEPYSMLDAMVNSNKIKNIVSFRACPSQRLQDSWIDIGNMEKYSDCGGNIAFTYSPSKSYHTVNILNIYVDAVQVKLPSTFQNVDTSIGRYSIIDSCSSYLYVPSSVMDDLRVSIKLSGGLPSKIRNDQSFLELFLKTQIATSLDDFDWKKLPTLTFETVSDQITTWQNKTLKIVMGPEQYIQNINGFCIFI
jgi:hypothetical protein